MSVYRDEDAHLDAVAVAVGAEYGMDASAEHKVTALTEECARLRAMVPGQRRSR